MYRGASPRATAILAITKPRKSSQRRQPVSAGCSYGSFFLGGLRRPVAGVAGAALPSCCVCWWAVSLLWQSHKAKTPGDTTPRARGRRWHWRSGDRPSYLSGPRRKEPRSAAERLLALETKFLLFWAGQEQDSVLSRSPAQRSWCLWLRTAQQTTGSAASNFAGTGLHAPGRHLDRRLASKPRRRRSAARASLPVRLRRSLRLRAPSPSAVDPFAADAPGPPKNHVAPRGVRQYPCNASRQQSGTLTG